MERLFKLDFWNRALARATRTAAQGFVAALAGCATLGDINWIMIGSTTAVAVMMSLATSVLFELPEEKEEIE